MNSTTRELMASHIFDTGADALDREEQIANLVERYGENTKLFLKDMCVTTNAQLPLNLRKRILKSKNKIYYWTMLVKLKRLKRIDDYEKKEYPDLQKRRVARLHEMIEEHKRRHCMHELLFKSRVEGTISKW